MAKFSYSLLLGLLVTAGWTVAALGEESEIQARMAALEQEVAELRMQPQAVATDFESCNVPACGECMATSATGYSKRTLEIGAELTLLRLHIGSLVLRDFIKEEYEVTPDYNLDAAFRVWLERQSNNGLGWRVSYWRFSDMASLELNDGDAAGTVINSGLDFYTVDLELTRRGQLCGWGINSSMGVRIGGMGIDESIEYDGNRGSLKQDFTGAGLTFSIGTQQDLWKSNWSVYGGFRGSLLYGVTDFDATANVDQYVTFDGGVKGSVAGQTMSVLEMQLGLQYERCTRYGLLFGRVGLETQLWELPPVIFGLGDKNVGLIGPTFLIGLRR